METDSSLSIDKQLRFAITNKRLVEIRYHGRLRIAEPHDYGVHKGIDRLLICQLRAQVHRPGKSARGWRLLDVPQIETCRVLEAQFHGSRGSSHRNHVQWEILYARVG